MKVLDFFHLQDFDKLVFPQEFHELTLDSPALSLVSDFKHHHPSVLTTSVSALDAAQIMRTGHLNAVLVMNHHGDFVGVLTSADVSYQRVMQCVAAGTSRQELTVADLMRSRNCMQLLCYQQIQKSTVRDVLQAMRKHRQRECLVVDTEHHHVRGLISAEDVAARVNAEFSIGVDSPATFAEMLRAVAPAH